MCRQVIQLSADAWIRQQDIFVCRGGHHVIAAGKALPPLLQPLPAWSESKMARA